MKNFKLALLVFLLVAFVSSTDAFAQRQRKINKTSSARAAYGFAPPATKKKKKKEKAHKHKKEKTPAYRRRGSWAS